MGEALCINVTIVKWNGTHASEDFVLWKKKRYQAKKKKKKRQTRQKKNTQSARNKKGRKEK